MPTIDLIIHGNKHIVSCNDGEEPRLRLLADKFNTKLEQIAQHLKHIDDKTLYLITALILLDEIEEKKQISNNKTSPSEQQELLNSISDKIVSMKNMLSPK
ncbi:MAG: cell division protein ZapA [Rickettsiales bacterium]|nr:cell division protein ZapA [Rickettsiales bacterium]